MEQEKNDSKYDVLEFVKLSEYAFSPVKGSERAADFDIESAYPYVVKAFNIEVIKTVIQIKVPRGTYGRIAPRFGLTLNNFIHVGAGVIDEDYRGDICIILFNHSDQDFIVNRGDRVAQLICRKIAYPELRELQVLDETIRGECGFRFTRKD